jgi:hypothetical protein
VVGHGDAPERVAALRRVDLDVAVIVGPEPRLGARQAGLVGGGGAAPGSPVASFLFDTPS